MNNPVYEFFWWLPEILIPNETEPVVLYQGADKSLARPGRKQAHKHVRDARDFINIETLAVNIFFARQCAEGNSSPFWQKH